MKVLRYIALFLAFGIFASCSPLGDGVEEPSSGAGNIVIALGAQAPSRTALPSEGKDSAKDFCDIVLYGSKSGEMAKLASWETYANIARDETSITVADGSWNFRLTAKRYGVLFSQTLSGVTVRSNAQTTLSFANMQVDAANTGTNGAIEAKLHIYSWNSGSAYVSAKLDDGEASEKEYVNFSSVAGGYTYAAEDVAQGNHVVTVFVYKDKDGGSLFCTIPFYANVIPGYKSTMDTYFSVSTVSNTSSVTGHTVTYKANYPSGTADDFAQDYFDGCSILDARGIGFAYSAGGKRFAYWTTDAAGNGTKYYAGDAPQFTADITLYAQWKVFSNVIYCLNPLDSNKENETYTQQYDSSSSLVAIDTTNFSQKMSGYVFCGWDTKPDGTGTRYAPNDRPTVQDDTTLYAQWCSTYSLGTGYQINSVKEWYALFRAPTSLVDAFSATIYLSGNMNYSGAGITTLTRAKAFSGTFNGRGTTFSGITQPLFTTVTGTVMSVNIASSTIQGAGAIAETCAAGGSISSCSVASTVSVTGTTSDKFVGGIVGTNNGTVSSCDMKGSVSTSTEGTYVGGIVGKNAGTVSSPTVTGATVTASSRAYGAAGVAGYNSSSVTDATVTQSKITGGIYAYVNETAIGLSGTATTTSVSGNTLSGKSNVVCTNESTTISYKDEEADFYKTFETAMRSGKVAVTVTANKGSASVFLYKGTDKISTVPNTNTTASSAGALLFSGFDYIGTTSLTYTARCDLLSSIECDYIMRIYNSNTFVGNNIAVTYSIELE